MRSDAKAILIVGCYRSGTSMVAGAVERSGVFFGKKDELYSGDAHNEGGYYEHRRLNAIVRKFLLSLNLPTYGVDPIPADWRERPASEDMLSKLSATLSRTFSNHTVWGWKDPQLSTLMPFALDAINELGIKPRVVICVRDPMEVALSQERRTGENRLQTLGEWLLATLAALRDSRGLNRTIVCHDRFLKDPHASFASLCKDLDLGPFDSQLKDAVAWIQPGLTHRKERSESGNLEILNQTYELCLRANTEPSRFRAGDFDDEIEGIWRTWVQVRGLFSRPPLAEAIFTMAWHRAGELQKADQRFVPSRSWQTVRLTTNALPNSNCSITFYPLPAVVWLRRVAWHHGNGETATKLLAGENGSLGEEFGKQRVWLMHGAEQATVITPEFKGPFELEIEFLVETGNVITGLIFRQLSHSN
jgi:hypothetical protein